MDQRTIYKLKNDKKMHECLKENSSWYKYLNRSSSNYEKFVTTMKKQYHLGVTDKISDAIDNIDLISTLMKTMK